MLDTVRKTNFVICLFLAACRYLGYPMGYVLERELEVVSMSDPLLSLMCRERGDDIMHCDWSEFYTNSSDCSPDEDRHYIVCGTGEITISV